MREKILTDPLDFSTIDLHGDFYLGEYPWHPSLEGADSWSSPSAGWYALSVATRPTVTSYTCERSGYDYSVDKTVSVQIPAPWLADIMGLRMTNGRVPVYVDELGCEIFYDPSVREAGPAAALIDRDAFLQLLEREELSAAWIIGGEKSAYGGRDPGMGFGGRMLHTAIYRLSSDGFERHFHSDLELPSKDQLVEFYGEEASNSDAKRI